MHKIETIQLLKGDRGEPGQDSTVPGPVGKDGRDGYTPIKGKDYFDGKDGRSIVGPRGPQGEKGESATPIYKTEIIKQELTLTEDIVKEIVRLMRKLPMKDRLEIQDIRNANSFMFQGTRYKTEELMHGGSSGTASSSILDATGDIDDSNMTFTFTSEPTQLVINSGNYRQTGGAITWTYLSGTVTLSSPVGTGGSIYGVQ